MEWIRLLSIPCRWVEQTELTGIIRTWKPRWKKVQGQSVRYLYQMGGSVDIFTHIELQQQRNDTLVLANITLAPKESSQAGSLQIHVKAEHGVPLPCEGLCRVRQRRGAANAATKRKEGRYDRRFQKLVEIRRKDNVFRSSG